MEDERDLEKGDAHGAYMSNADVKTFSWQAINVSSRRERGEQDQSDSILNDVDGHVTAGELMAIMGPSGSGKTSLLNVLAQRDHSKYATTGSAKVNGSQMSNVEFRSISSYVEQEDALIGSLTVKETMNFAARLSLPSVSTQERRQRVDHLIRAFGLQGQADTLVGTPIRKGISGGQKRRLSIASQLISSPKVLFLDEPSSGLDSKASFEVIKYLKLVARRHKIVVIASIHQPSSATFELFDSLLLLSSGETSYFGPTSSVRPYVESIGFVMPLYVNPAEFLLDLTSSDFSPDQSDAQARVQKLHHYWRVSERGRSLKRLVFNESSNSEPVKIETNRQSYFLGITVALLHRSFIKSYRDVVAYGIRFVMYIGLALMMGTVWLRLPPTEMNIQPIITGIFFGSAFMSFMAVAYVPSFLEDRATFVKERANGYYGATPFLTANFLIGTPYLFLISLSFSIISYWLGNFRPSGSAFFTWVMWLFLDLLAAESLVVLISTIFPNFVIALALTAFANGLWMSVGGFLVSPEILNVFWRYVFHYIDYQAYVFRGMMVNEFGFRTYDCRPGCHCMYESELQSQCKIDGKAVLAEYGYRTGDVGKWVGIMLAIIFAYRLVGFGVTYVKRS